MASNLDKFKSDLSYLINLGKAMILELELKYLKEEGKLSREKNKLLKDIKVHFEEYYQRWYTESFEVIRKLIPNRLDEFEQLYQGHGKRKEIKADTYVIQDWLNGIRSPVNAYTKVKYFDDFAITAMRFRTQTEILKTAEARFESSLLDIHHIIQADIFDSELEASRELNRKGFSRGAGAMAGVVLESHLKKVCENHRLKTVRKYPGIAYFNDLLKENEIIEISAWRFVQHLGDLRNKCDHKTKADPTIVEIDELIEGVEKISKTIF